MFREKFSIFDASLIIFNKMISFDIFSHPYLVFTTMPHFWMAAKYIPSVKEALSWLSSWY